MMSDKTEHSGWKEQQKEALPAWEKLLFVKRTVFGIGLAALLALTSQGCVC
jgi:hypothetical protein